MADRVIVVLDRDEAHRMVERGFTEEDNWTRPDHDVWWAGHEKLRAALDRDPGELEERVADVIEALDGQDYLDVAAAVLAALSGEEDTDGD